jgi:hypothetical protein
VNVDGTTSSYSYSKTTPTTYGMRIGQQITGTGIPAVTLSGGFATTAGSDQITVSSAAGLNLGMAVNGGNIPDGTTITNINGTTITLSNQATATATATANGAASFNSVITSIVDGTHFTINDNATSTNSNLTDKIVQSGGMLAQLSANSGIQMISQGSSGNTTVVGTPQGTTGSPTGNQYGYSISQDGFGADKTGKDDNFRGLTLNPYNGLMYTTKGSGGNGINGIYQIGTAGNGLPGSNASSTSISLINGFPPYLATNGKDASGTAHQIYTPFGLWFAAANVLYVGDEGSGGTLESPASAGLQKWVNSKADGTGTWSLAYTLQNGLNLGTKFSVPNDANGDVYPTALDPANQGLRNITGHVNSDGTVTIWGVTSTTSANTDQGADPNQIVSITDTLSDATASDASGESFNVLETASYGQVFRGVAVAAVPEPASASLLLVGTAFLGIRRRRKA